MLPAKVLLISDDLESMRVWSYALQQSGLQTNTTEPPDKDDTLSRFEPAHDLIVIDIYSPQINRAALVRRMRGDVTIPILLLMHNQDEVMMLDAYTAGADEVISGSISFKLLLAKITAWLRRSWTVPTSLLDSFQAGSLRLDTAHRQLVRDSGEVIRLTGLEFRLIHLLMSHADQVLTSSMLVDRIWGVNGDGDSALLKNLIYRLRRKIEPDPGHPRYIQAVAGEGYRFSSYQNKEKS